MDQVKGGMLTGDLEVLGLPDVLQVLALGSKTGALWVEDGPRHVVLYFDNGQVVDVDESPPCRRSLNEVLEDSGRLAPEQIERIRRLRRENPKRVDHVLANLGVIARPILEQHQRLRVTEAVGHVLQWRSGHYRFELGQRLSPEEVAQRYPVANLVLEGLRASDEWQMLRTSIPSLEAVPQKVGDALEDAQGLALGSADWRVLSRCNGRYSIRNIAELLLSNELEVARVVYALITAGLVRLVAIKTVTVSSPVPIRPDTREPVAAEPLGPPAAAGRAEAVEAAAQPATSTAGLPAVVEPVEQRAVPEIGHIDGREGSHSLPGVGNLDLGEIIGQLVEQARQASQHRQQDMGDQIRAIVDRHLEQFSTPIKDLPALRFLSVAESASETAQPLMEGLVNALVDSANELLDFYEVFRLEELDPGAAEERGRVLHACDAEFRGLLAAAEEVSPALGALQVAARRIDAEDLIESYEQVNGEGRRDFYRDVIRGLIDLDGTVLEMVLRARVSSDQVVEDCLAAWRAKRPALESRISRMNTLQQGEDQRAWDLAHRKRK